MNNTPEYWKQWFDNRAKSVSSDYVLNRGTTVRLVELERKAERQFLDAIDPAEDEIVLDAGCGSGRNISLLSPRVKAITGLDFSKEMLDRAQARVEAEGLDNVTLLAASVTDLPFADNTFDKVICTSVLQYLEADDCRRALAEMFRVAKPGATLVVHLKNGTSLYGISKAVANTLLATFNRPVYPEFYRSRAWHESSIQSLGGKIIGVDSLGILTFVRMPRPVVQFALRVETKLPAWMKRYGVNYKATIRVAK